MGKTKSFLKNISIDTAKSSHSCKHNKKHKINKGDKRLKLKKNRAFQHFFFFFSKESLKKDISELNAFLIELEKVGQQE
jgi:hypothetical protein